MLWNDPFAPLFAQLTGAAAFVPAADVTVSDGDLVLTMDVPGLSGDDLSIELEDGYLTVHGERTRPQLAEGTAYVRAERPVGTFERRFRVPRDVDPDAITASVDHGVLSLIIPKPDRMKPKTIPIGTGTAQRELETATA